MGKILSFQNKVFSIPFGKNKKMEVGNMFGIR
jgi:hypothetical protein